jgi:hypothetical protein
MILARRSFLGLLAAPAIIKVADLMPIKAFAPSERDMLRYADPARVLAGQGIVWDASTGDISTIGQFTIYHNSRTIKFRRPAAFTVEPGTTYTVDFQSR